MAQAAGVAQTGAGPDTTPGNTTATSATGQQDSEDSSGDQTTTTSTTAASSTTSTTAPSKSPLSPSNQDRSRNIYNFWEYPQVKQLLNCGCFSMCKFLLSQLLKGAGQLQADRPRMIVRLHIVGSQICANHPVGRRALVLQAQGFDNPQLRCSSTILKLFRLTV